MGPKKRSPPSNIQTQPQQFDRAGEPDPTFQQSPPAQSRGKRRRQPRDSGPGISPVQSSTQGHVDPSLSSHPVADSPHHSSEGETAPESSSRRQSTSSTMRTSSMPVEGPISQTPTGRISKAKKGKRVHACAFEGCGKVSLTALSSLQSAQLRNYDLGANLLLRSSPGPSIVDDMNSITTLKQCSHAIVPDVARRFTVLISFNAIKNDSKCLLRLR